MFRFEELLEEEVDLFVGFGIGGVGFAVGHGDTVVIAEDVVDGD